MSASRREDRARLRAVRAVLRAHRERPGQGDLVYAVYMGLMLVIAVIAPIVRAVVLELAEALPGAAPFDAVLLLGAVLLALTALAALGAVHLGPARAGLPEIDLLLSTDLPRAGLLGGRVRRGFAVGAGTGALLAAMLLAARAMRGEFEPALAVALLTAWAAAGLLLVAAMLAAQVGRAPRWWLAGMLGALALLRLREALSGGSDTVADPWSVAALLALMGSGSELVPASEPGQPLLIAANGLALLAAWALNRLRAATA